MAVQQNNQLDIIFADIGTRMRELEERTSSVRERVLLINTNVLTFKEDMEQRILNLEKTISTLSKDIKKMNEYIKNILSETNNFVRKDEIILVERMLKNFQPLEFVRKKDLEIYQLNSKEKSEKKNPSKRNKN